MTIFRSLARDDCAGISDSVRTFLSKYDEQGLVALGFESFAEACSVLGLALNVPLAILKNHRNELDPSFPNRSRA